MTRFGPSGRATYHATDHGRGFINLIMFRAAAEQGADMIECDLALTKVFLDF